MKRFVKRKKGECLACFCHPKGIDKHDHLFQLIMRGKCDCLNYEKDIILESKINEYRKYNL